MSHDGFAGDHDVNEFSFIGDIIENGDFKQNGDLMDENCGDIKLGVAALIGDGTFIDVIISSNFGGLGTSSADFGTFE